MSTNSNPFNRVMNPMKVAGFSVALLALTSCAQCAPGLVGAGAARLTVRNAGALVSIISADTTCGFASDQVSEPTAENGALTWRVSDCEIDLGDKTVISESCDGNETVASGKVTISASRTIEGVITGNDETPIIPTHPDAVTIKLTSVQFDHFKVTSSASPASLTNVNGGLTATVKPRLAASESTGVCAIVTPHVAFSDIVYSTDSEVVVDSGSSEIDATIGGSLIHAQNGRSVHGQENTITGTIVVEGTEVPVPGDGDGLDPDYEPTKFNSSYGCTEDLRSPTDFDCMQVDALLATGSARLTAKAFGVIAALVEADTSCGFSSEAASQSATLSGPIGSAGSATVSVESCAITIPSEFVTDTDCNGVSTLAEGRVIVSGQKTIEGLITGGLETPVVPLTDSPATLSLNIELDGFRVWSDGDANALFLQDGTLSGRLSPKVAVSSETGVCSAGTPEVIFEELSYENANIKLSSDSGDFDVLIESSSVNAVNGQRGGQENHLDGTVRIDGVSYHVPNDGLGLNPEYNAEDFQASWSCQTKYAQPISYDCGLEDTLEPVLADGATRLSIKYFATVASLLDADTNCGFSSEAALAAATVTGAVGESGTAQIQATNCTIIVPVEETLEPDCDGVATRVAGSVTVSGTKTLTGRVSGSTQTPVIPESSTPAEISLTITGGTLEVGSTADVNAFTLQSGELIGTLIPQTAMASENGICSISTPNAQFTEMEMNNAQLTLATSAGEFAVFVSEAEYEAVNGQFGNLENHLEGQVSIDERSFDVPVDGLGLNPDYDAVAFAEAWQCQAELMQPINQTCDLDATMGQAAARLTTKFLGSVAALVEQNEECGFSSHDVSVYPALTGEIGSSEGTAVFSIDTPCEIILETPLNVSEDCTGVQTYLEGQINVTGTKTVSGFRTGNPLTPIVPTSSMPAQITLQMELIDARMTTNEEDAPSLTIASGLLSGSLAPKTALDTSSGACSISTPVATFSSMQWTDAQVEIESSGNRFPLSVGSSSLNAQNGKYGDSENSLEGTITLNERSIDIPVYAGDTGLNPDYDATSFLASYSCAENFALPETEEECSFREVLGYAAARLLTKSVGTATKLVNENDNCGFYNLDINNAPSLVGGEVGEPGFVQWTAESCMVTLPEDQYPADCHDVQVTGSGSFSSDIRKYVTGIRDDGPLILPDVRDAGTMYVDYLNFDAFELYDLDLGQTTPETSSTVWGTVTGALKPIAGESGTMTTLAGFPVYAISTPVIGLTYEMASGTMQIVSEGNTFVIQVDTVTIDAFAGSYAERTNELQGSLVVDGQPVVIPNGTPLDPEYDQTYLDESYVCSFGLEGTVPPAMP